jgi:hypothetical protein
VLLTQPTIATPDTLHEPISATFEQDGNQVKMTVFLSAAESATLEELWMQLRISPARPSKGDLVRAALTIALEDPKRLEAEILKRKGLT